MTAEIRIYIDGGGDSKLTRGPLRQGFTAFFKSIKDKAYVKVIMCGSCNDAYRNYLLALKTHPAAVNILLVDAEGPVADSDSAGDHLRRREWKLPQTQDPRYHLMVQAMEALFVADPDTLAQYYGQHFRRNALPKHANLESVSVQELAIALKKATQETTAGEYKKIHHAAKLLTKINVPHVRTILPHFDQLFTFLHSLI